MSSSPSNLFRLYLSDIIVSYLDHYGKKLNKLWMNEVLLLKEFLHHADSPFRFTVIYRLKSCVISECDQTLPNLHEELRQTVWVNHYHWSRREKSPSSLMPSSVEVIRGRGSTTRWEWSLSDIDPIILPLTMCLSTEQQITGLGSFLMSEFLIDSRMFMWKQRELRVFNIELQRDSPECQCWYKNLHLTDITRIRMLEILRWYWYENPSPTIWNMPIFISIRITQSTHRLPKPWECIYSAARPLFDVELRGRL